MLYLKIIKGQKNSLQKTKMAGEFFQSERNQISGIEAQATKEKKTEVASDSEKTKRSVSG
jgi:hypothetical protein